MLLGNELITIYEKLNGACLLLEEIEGLSMLSNDTVYRYSKETQDILHEVLGAIRDSLDEEPSDLNFDEDNQ